MNIPLNINWQQILLHLMNFAILGGGLYFLLYKPVKGFMDKRAAHYQEMDDAAAKKVADAEKLEASYQEKLKDAENEIRRERAKAQQSVKDMTDQRLAEAQAQADTILKDAQATAEHSRRKILQDANKELQELAVTATEKLLLQSGGDAIDQFLNTAERGQSHEQPQH